MNGDYFTGIVDVDLAENVIMSITYEATIEHDEQNTASYLGDVVPLNAYIITSQTNGLLIQVSVKDSGPEFFMFIDNILEDYRGYMDDARDYFETRDGGLL